MAKVLAFANQKGGVAKTTTTLNLGVAFQEMGYKVLAVDMDPQGNLTMSLGLDPDSVRPSMYDVLVQRGQHRGGAATTRARHRRLEHRSGGGRDRPQLSVIGRERALSKALMQVSDRYDYIVIDTPPSLGLLTINALTAADAVIVPVQCEYLSLRGLAQLEKTLELVRENLNPRRAHRRASCPPCTIPGRYTGERPSRCSGTNFGDLVFSTAHPQDHQVRGSAGQGESVLQVCPRQPSGQCISAARKRGAQWKKDLA